MNKVGNKKSNALIIAAFAAIYIIWGSTYFAILVAIKTIPPFFMAGIRFLIGGSILLAGSLLKGEKFPDRQSILKTALVGVLLLSIGNTAVAWVEQYLPSSLVAIMVATVPLWFVLLDKRQWKFYFSNWQIIFGLIVGFAGVVVLFSGKNASAFFNSKMKLISLVVLGFSTVSWTAGSLYSKYQQINGSTLMKVALQMLSASVVIFLFGFLSNEQKNFALSQVSGQSIAGLIYLILFGSLVGYLAYIWLLSVRPASLVGTYAYVNPGVAVFLGWLFAGETISVSKIIGLVIVILGLLIVNISKDKKTATAINAQRLPMEEAKDYVTD